MKCGRAGAWHAAASVVQNVPADTSRAWSANARRRFDIGVRALRDLQKVGRQGREGAGRREGGGAGVGRRRGVR